MSEALDKQIEVADVYADALFSLAEEQAQTATVRAELEELVKVLETDAPFGAFMSSAALSSDHRAAGLERMLRGKLSDITLDTLQVMNGHGRSELLKALLVAFRRRQRDAAGQVDVGVTSAVELDGAQKQEIEKTAADLTGKKPLLKFDVDESLIGGLIVQIGDVRYDNSVRRKLRVLRDRLLDRSARGLPVLSTN